MERGEAVALLFELIAARESCDALRELEKQGPDPFGQPAIDPQWLQTAQTHNARRFARLLDRLTDLLTSQPEPQSKGD